MNLVAVAAMIALGACGGGNGISDASGGVSDVQATPHPEGVEVSWTFEGTATRFEIFRETVDDASLREQSLSLIATVTDGSQRSWIDREVTAGTTYRYGVAANGGAPVVADGSGVTPDTETESHRLEVLFDTAVPDGVSIVSDPVGIDCAGPGEPGCRADFAAASEVRLRAEGGSASVSWSGCDGVSDGACLVTLAAARAVHVAFVSAGDATLHVQVDPPQAGLVTSVNDLGSNPDVECRDACTYGYPQELGLAIGLRAEPADDDYVFASWAGDCGGSSCTVTMTQDRSVTAQFQLRAPTILSFSASPDRILRGESATLAWDVDGGGDMDEGELVVSIEPEVGIVGSRSGSVQVQPRTTTTYTLRVENAQGVETMTQTVRVGNGPRIDAFDAEPQTVAPDDSSQLSWSVDSGGVTTQLTLQPDDVDVTGRSTYVVSPDTTTTYTLQASNVFGDAEASVRVVVEEPEPNEPEPDEPTGPPPTIVRFFANHTEIDDDGWAWLFWTVEDADSVSIEPGMGEVPPDDKRRIRPDKTTTYTLRAVNAYGKVEATVTVTVDD